jgi:hypothetical protein
MRGDGGYRPSFPSGVETGHHEGTFGRVRSRNLGTARTGVPELVLEHGMTSCAYMLPGLGELSA